MTPRLQVDTVRKSFGRREVLRGASFDVGAGEIVAIVGENGAGKSTLLRIVAGLLDADSGAVRVDGRAGYCDQNAQVFPDLTVEEHFRYFARAYDLDDRWRANAAALLSRFAFEPYAAMRVSHLSSGTVQKLHLALSLLHGPDLLILDEPYVAFDWQTYLRFWELAAELRNAGVAVLVVSHIAYERHRFDRILELREGVVACE
jgi:ABC-2 type transport system ATP-binding protein